MTRRKIKQKADHYEEYVGDLDFRVERGIPFRNNEKIDPHKCLGVGREILARCNIIQREYKCYSKSKLTELLGEMWGIIVGANLVGDFSLWDEAVNSED